MIRDESGPPDLQRAAERAHDAFHALHAVQRSIQSAAQQILAETPTPAALVRARGQLESAEFDVRALIYAAANALVVEYGGNVGAYARPHLVSRSPVDILMEMLPPYAARAGAKGIAFDGPEPTVEPFPPLRLELFTMHLVLHNVLSNALKYSYTAVNIPNERRIVIGARRHDNAGSLWAVSVQNYGVGILPDELNKVFDPGYRGREARREGVFGQGLGLSAVRRGMALHGGRVEVASHPTQGPAYVTTVTLIWPRHTNVGEHFKHATALDG